jgi:alcohol dehydrogenase class IV
MAFQSEENNNETFRDAFPDHEESPKLSYGLPFPIAAAKHAEQTFNSSRVYVLCSGSLSRNTDALNQLKEALGEKFVGVRIGMKSHTLWSEIIEVVTAAREAKADLLLTLGAGSLTDGAKIVAFVSFSILHLSMDIT